MTGQFAQIRAVVSQFHKRIACQQSALERKGLERGDLGEFAHGWLPAFHAVGHDKSRETAERGREAAHDYNNRFERKQSLSGKVEFFEE